MVNKGRKMNYFKALSCTYYTMDTVYPKLLWTNVLRITIGYLMILSTLFMSRPSSFAFRQVRGWSQGTLSLSISSSAFCHDYQHVSSTVQVPKPRNDKMNTPEKTLACLKGTGLSSTVYVTNVEATEHPRKKPRKQDRVHPNPNAKFTVNTNQRYSEFDEGLVPFCKKVKKMCLRVNREVFFFERITSARVSSRVPVSWKEKS